MIISFVALLTLLIVVKQLLPEKTSEAKVSTENRAMKHFTPHTISSGSDSQYTIQLVMGKDGKFHVDTTVNIKNTSNDSWEELMFYFIPNIFTKVLWSSWIGH